MQQEIRDDAAIAFSKGFYRALGYECSIEQSYEFGCNAIQLEISGSSKVTRSALPEARRKLEVVSAVANTPLPEHLKPILKKKPTLSSLTSDQSLTEATRVSIQVDVDKALVEEATSLQQYRERVREFLADRKLSDVEKIRLEQLRKKLGLSVEEASTLLAEEQEPLVRAQAEYREMLEQLIEQGCYPFNAAITRDLEKIQQELELSDEEVEAISQSILAEAEAVYREQKRQMEEERQRELEQQRQLEAQRKQEEIRRKFQLQPFEFQFVTVRIVNRSCDIHYQQGQAEYFVEELGNGVTLEMVKIPDGSFQMGSPETEKDRYGWESPQHPVHVSAFFMGKFAVTQAQYRQIMGNNPADFQGESHPVERVSWNDAVEFCTKLSQRTGRTYRLPSEAEWEYACRAGTTTPFHFGETITSALANYNARDVYQSGSKGEYREQTTAVGQFPPNAFGLYDMHGNVWEWCQDHWHKNYRGAPNDGSAWLSENENAPRLMRGGSWFFLPQGCRSAYRDRFDLDGRDPALGFRVVCSLA
ncbi:MAG: SUMF1/EgtB/PvdO family nonheme iron enzyme [Elainella sp. C42_A2020_010]|nr:SUMF1/EgtB/PvdO family nonheme iron enzyme [Elainella sp. C42_A2020_010]